MSFKIYEYHNVSNGWDDVFLALQEKVYSVDPFFSGEFVEIEENLSAYEITMSDGTVDQKAALYKSPVYSTQGQLPEWGTYQRNFGSLSNISNGESYRHSIPSSYLRYEKAAEQPLLHEVTDFFILHDAQNRSLAIIYKGSENYYKSIILGYRSSSINSGSLNKGFYFSITCLPSEDHDRDFELYQPTGKPTVWDPDIDDYSLGSVFSYFNGDRYVSYQGFSFAVIDDNDSPSWYMGEMEDAYYIGNIFLGLGIGNTNGNNHLKFGMDKGVNSYNGRPFLVPLELSIFSNLSGYYDYPQPIYLGDIEGLFCLNTGYGILPEERVAINGKDFIFFPYSYPLKGGGSNPYLFNLALAFDVSE